MSGDGARTHTRCPAVVRAADVAHGPGTDSADGPQGRVSGKAVMSRVSVSVCGVVTCVSCLCGSLVFLVILLLQSRRES